MMAAWMKTVLLVLAMLYVVAATARAFPGDDLPYLFKEKRIQARFWFRAPPRCAVLDQDDERDDLKILVISQDTRDSQYITSIRDWNRARCEQYGVDFKFVSGDPYEGKVPVFWTKMFLVKEALAIKEYSHVVWCDSDAMIVGDVRDLVAAYSKFPIAVSLDPTSPLSSSFLNAGFFVVQNSEEGERVFESIMKYFYTAWNSTSCWTEGNNVPRMGWMGRVCYEQGAINRVYVDQADGEDSIQYIPQCYVYGSAMPGMSPSSTAYVIHMLGTPAARRQSTFESLAATYESR